MELEEKSIDDLALMLRHLRRKILIQTLMVNEISETIAKKAKARHCLVSMINTNGADIHPHG